MSDEYDEIGDDIRTILVLYIYDYKWFTQNIGLTILFLTTKIYKVERNPGPDTAPNPPESSMF